VTFLFTFANYKNRLKSKGSKNLILWGFTFEDENKTLRWCPDGRNLTKSHPVPIPVRGRTDKPYVLMSLPSNEPNLNAVDVLDAYNVTILYCLHYGNSSKNVGQKINPINVENSLENFDAAFNAFV
jgi:hypothetical protein